MVKLREQEGPNRVHVVRVTGGWEYIHPQAEHNGVHVDNDKHILQND